jgi:hypothetical protein
MNIFTRTKIINVPKLGFSRNGEVNWDRVFGVAFATLGFLLVATFASGLSYKVLYYIDRKPGPPPKVITKTVYQSALTGAQQAYIKQCGSNTNGDNNNGIPNVESRPWTCTYAH